MGFSPRTNTHSTISGLSASDPSPQPTKIEGPTTLVSTVDSAGLWVSYSAVGLPSGGTYAWTIVASTPQPCIEIQSPATGNPVNVRALANRSSVAASDQTLRCTYSLNGQQTILNLAITVARPSYANVTNGGKTTSTASLLSRTLQYQLVDQFSNNLSELYSYTNAASQTVTVRVVNLLVSEQLNVVVKDPSTAPNPTPSTNVGVQNTGGFSDTHQLPRNIEFQVNQIIQAHIQPWTSNNQGFGNPVRYLIIKVDLETAPEKIRIYENNNGQPGNEIPEQP